MEKTIMHRKTLLILGASYDQLYLIKTAKSMGFFVIVSDINKDSIGFEFADDYTTTNFKDLPKILKWVKKYNDEVRKIDGVITMGCDVPVEISTICKEICCQSITINSALLATNKYKMKVALKKKGVPIPWFKKIKTIEELNSIFNEKKFPLVIKPVDRSGSRGVFILNKDVNLKKYFDKAINYSFSNEVLIEEFLEGPQISTESIIYDGQIKTPGFADRDYSLNKAFYPYIMENGATVPTKHSKYIQKRIDKLILKVANALGIKRSVIKGDVVLTKNGPKIIEIAARLSGGEFSSGLIPYGCGINIVEQAINISLGIQPTFSKLDPKFTKYVSNEYFFPKSGKLLKIEGLEKINRLNWIKKITFFYNIGDYIPWPSHHGKRFGFCLIVADSFSQLKERIKYVRKELKIITEKCQPST